MKDEMSTVRRQKSGEMEMEMQSVQGGRGGTPTREKGTFKPPLLLGKLDPRMEDVERACEFSMTFLPRGHFNL